MKTFRLLLLAVAANLNLMAQDTGGLRAERDKLMERGMWRDAVDLYEEKLMPVSDSGSGRTWRKRRRPCGG